MRVPFLITATITVCPAFFVACLPEPVEPEPKDPALPILGGEAHDLSAMNVEELLTVDDGLANPRDIELHPLIPDQLWVLNHDDSSMVIASNVGEDGQSTVKHNSFGNSHFMPLPSALAFGLDSGTMATAHEEDEVTQPGTPADFMGPTLWLADPERFDAGHDSHMDMLHNSPLAMGIAWEQGNAYWVFDGAHSSITRYDFGADHGPGGTDHSDGDVARYVEGEVKAVRGIASHIELDRETGMLYVADTGNARVAVLDTTSGERGANVAPNYDGGQQYRVDGATLTTLIDGETNFLSEPTGLALHDGTLFVSNRKNGEIQAYALDGQLRGYLDTGLEAIGGIAFDVEGRLYVVDTDGNRVLRLSPK